MIGDHHGRFMCPENCCSSKFRTWREKKGGVRHAELTCPHEHYGVHSPIKRDVWIKANLCTAFHPYNPLPRVVH
jgi:hypothetical protein